MFSYYGSKSKIIKRYPPPEHETIVEPFAGSARYACLYGLERDVWINDLYQPILRIWRWVREASLTDLKRLPELKRGEDLRDIKWLSHAERDLLGFAVTMGDHAPRNIATGWAAEGGEISRLKKRLTPYVGGNISHWKITCRDFRAVKVSHPATYFIDPPYQHRRKDYMVPCNPQFYSTLRSYCRKRSGLKIICEQLEATWWDFTLLVATRGGQMGRRQCESIKILRRR